MPSYDVIVVGVGGMGSAIAAHCARRGLRVLALEQHAIGHELGSSHGLTRIIRLAYFEDPRYVPLLRRAYALWRELEQGLDAPLLHVTGALDVGWQEGEVFEGSLHSCRVHGLAHDVLDATQLAARYPGWRPADRAMAVFQPDGGFLTPERCIAAHVADARAHGATVREFAPVQSWRARDGQVVVHTDDDAFEAGQLVLAAGAWMGDLVPSLRPVLTPERQVLGWFEISARAAFAPARFPVFVLDADEGRFYGFPEFGIPGFKIGRYHHLGEHVHPETMRRDCTPADEATLRAATARYFPAANGALRHARACLFTNTPDEHFIIDRAPETPEVLLVSPCSGHGFKFCSVVGEIGADLVTTGTTTHDVSLFGLARFGAR
jgi:sarcosine oxidase